MRIGRLKYIALAIVPLALAGGGMTLLNHQNPPMQLACFGGTNCGIVELYGSVESRPNQTNSSKVNCPSSATDECYETYTDTKNTSTGWGTSATHPYGENLPVVGPTLKTVTQGVTAGPATWGGFYDNTGSFPSGDGRVWTGAAVAGVGQTSVAAGGGAASGKPFGCVTWYGRDDLPGHPIATVVDQLTHIGATPSGDEDTDVQVCGHLLSGV